MDYIRSIRATEDENTLFEVMQDFEETVDNEDLDLLLGEPEEIEIEPWEFPYEDPLLGADPEMTLEALGLPWAECYRGSGRLTGRLAKEPVYCSNNDIAPGWCYVGDLTIEEWWETLDADRL